MTSRSWPALAAMMCALLSAVSPGQAQEGFEFMPKGGKALLIEMLGSSPDTDRLREIATASRTKDEWTAALAEWTAGLSKAERETLVNYLAINMPLAKKVLKGAETKGDVAAILPPDGRELAWNQCQLCHSLFTSYLTIDREAQGWLGTFRTPFHREIKMTAKERETFAHYSAINMPMKIEDVPEELRF